MASAAAAVAPPSTPLNPRPGEWLCEVCGNVNYGSRTRCHMSVCGAPRGFPGPYKQGMNIGRTGPTPQPWTCPVCRNFNRATRDQCHRTGCSVARTVTNGVVAFTCPPAPESSIHPNGAFDRKDGAAPPYSFPDKRSRGPPAHHQPMKQPPPQFVAPPPFQGPVIVAAQPSGGYSWGLVPQWGGGLPVLGRQQPMVIGGPPGSWIAPPGFSMAPPPGAIVIGGPGGVPMLASGADVGISAMGPGGAYQKVG